MFNWNQLLTCKGVDNSALEFGFLGFLTSVELESLAGRHSDPT